MSALYEIPHWHNIFSINSQEPNWNGQQNSGEFPLTSHVFCFLFYCTSFIVYACISAYSRPGSWGARIHSIQTNTHPYHTSNCWTHTGPRCSVARHPIVQKLFFKWERERLRKRASEPASKWAWQVASCLYRLLAWQLMIVYWFNWFVAEKSQFNKRIVQTILIDCAFITL